MMPHDAANVSDREVANTWNNGRAAAAYQASTGQRQMRGPARRGHQTGTVCPQEQCDACFISLRPLDQPGCVRQCRGDASFAACHRSSQQRLRCSGLGLRRASTADSLRRYPELQRSLEVWRRHGVASDALSVWSYGRSHSIVLTNERERARLARTKYDKSNDRSVA